MDWILVFGFVFGFYFGANHMNKLMSDPEYDIQESNVRLVFWGCICAVISILSGGWMEVISSYLFGLCFGLIGVNYMFEKRK